MGDPAPTQRRAPVGYRFRPTEEELVAYYLRHKLLADDPSIYTTIPEIDVCKQEPWDLLAWAVSAFPEIDPDDSECYFFSPRDYKYPNSTRRNRTTSLGYWKVTGRERKIRDRDTKNVIGIQKNLVFYKGRFPRGIKDNWVIHEYDNTMIPQEQRTYVLCRLMKKYEKKTKEKIIDCKHELIHAEKESNNHLDFEYENQANLDDVVSKEPYLSNMDSMISKSSQSEEAIGSITQIFSQPNEPINSRIEASYQLNEAINSIQTQSQFQSNEVTDSTIEPLPQSNEVISPELYSTIEAPFDFDSEEFYNSLHLQLSPTMYEQGLWEMAAPSYMLY